jgi:hypothetical protein
VIKSVAIRAALESAGVEFIAENGGGASVRLRKGYRSYKSHLLDLGLTRWAVAFHLLSAPPGQQARVEKRRWE